MTGSPHGPRTAATRLARAVGVTATMLAIAATVSCGSAATTATTTQPVAPTSRLTTTVTPPVHNPNHFDPLDVASSFLLYYAAGDRGSACAFMTDEYRNSPAAAKCPGALELEKLPVVTPVDNCRLPNGSFLFRFTVVPGVGIVELPVAGATQDLSVTVVKENDLYAVPGPPSVYDPATACAGSTS